MTHYFDIKLKAKTPYEMGELLNNLYSLLHKKIWEMKNTRIGVSFPEYRQHLGSVVRVHGKDTELVNFRTKSWLGELATECDFSEIKPTPEAKEFAVFNRVQQTQSNSKLKRFIKRNNPSEEEIRSYKAKLFGGSLDLPYLELLSTSTNQRHRIYIRRESSEQKEGTFTTYGLSKDGATVPVF